MDQTNKVIAICLSDLQNETLTLQVEAICKYAREREYQILIFNTFHQLDHTDGFTQGEKFIYNIIPLGVLSALIIFPISIANMDETYKLVGRARGAKIPVISVDMKLEGCYSVLLGYEKAFEKICRHVIEHHHCRKVNFMAGFKNNSFSDTRIQIYKKVLEDNQISFEEKRLAYGQFWEMPCRLACEKWVAMWESGMQDKPDAIIAANDIMALTICNVLQNHRYRIPEDIILTGFDGIGLEKYCTPRLTNAYHDIDLLGSEFLHLVDQCVYAQDLPPFDVEIPLYTKFSESCGCKPVEWCNPNEHIMYIDGRRALNRIQSSETFFMMTVLTENYSVMDMAKKLKHYPKKMGIRSMVLFLKYDFCMSTDVPCQGFDKESLVLLSQIKDGEYEILCEETPVNQIYRKMIEVFWRKANILYVPIHIQEEIYGFMGVSFEECKEDLVAFYNFALGLDQTLGTIKKQAQLHRMYITDNMTEMYNRRGFFSHLSSDFDRLQGRNMTLFVSSVDMDGLKFINDTYGHAEGDFAIKKTAEFLKASLKGKNGICARFGGDEYMVAMLEETERADISFYEQYDEILQKLVADFAKVSDKPYQVGVSIGSIYSKVQGMSEVDELMKRADAVMYDCKSRHHSSRLARIRENSRK